MAFTKIQNRRAVESIVVADGNSALPAGGTSLSGTGGVVNLSDGQLGVFSASSDGNVAINTALALGDTATDAPVIQIYQGTSNAGAPANADSFPAQSRPYEATEKIVGTGVVSWKGQSFRYPGASSAFIGGAAGVINTADESEYKIIIGYRGRRVDEFQSSVHGVPVLTASFTTPDYSTAGLTNDLDNLVILAANAINKNSRAFYQTNANFGGHEPVIALAIDVSGGAGVTLGAHDDPASPGSAFTVFTDANGVARTFTPTSAFAEAVRVAIATTNLTTSSTIEPYVVSTAGNVTLADSLLIVALDELPAAGVDRNKFKKIRIDVGLGGAFASTVNNQVASKADEGEGTGRQWKLYFNATAGLRKYSQNQWFYPVLTYPAVNDIDDAGQYDAYIIEHYDSKHMSLDRVDVNPKKSIILVDPADTTTTGSFEPLMNAYMASLGFPAVTL